jgi:hypothetical protein
MDTQLQNMVTRKAKEGSQGGPMQNPLSSAQQYARGRGFYFNELEQGEADDSSCRLVVDHNGGWRRLCGFLAMDRVVDFLAVHRNFLWSHDAQPNFIATNFDHGNRNVVVNDDAFIFFPGQY